MKPALLSANMSSCHETKNNVQRYCALSTKDMRIVTGCSHICCACKRHLSKPIPCVQLPSPPSHAAMVGRHMPPPQRPSRHHCVGLPGTPRQAAQCGRQSRGSHTCTSRSRGKAGQRRRLWQNLRQTSVSKQLLATHRCLQQCLAATPARLPRLYTAEECSSAHNISADGIKTPPRTSSKCC